ncbi:hypothetical protein CR513_06903, partial [Mucuna pruriens]
MFSSLHKYSRVKIVISTSLTVGSGFDRRFKTRMGIKFEDEILGLLLLNSLPKSWETFKENKGKKDKLKEKDHDDDDHVTIVTGDDLVILQDFELVNLVYDESMWIIDSDATLHVTPRKEFFTSYTSGDFGVLNMGNDGVTKLIGVGDVCLQTNIGMELWLRGVKHAPNVRFNFIFVHMFDGDGYDNHFFYEKWKLTKAKKNMLPRLKNAKLDKCSHCMAGKHTRSRKSKLLELVHSDVCGPLKSKDQVLEKFKRLQALVERQLGKKQGIRHETSPKTPQLNGLAERMNRTLIKRVRLYDPVEKKLIRSRDVQFMEDQTIEDNDKVKKITSEIDNSLSKIDLVWMHVHDLDTIENNVQNCEQHNYVGDQQLGDGFDIPLDDDDVEDQEMSQDENLGDAPEPPLVQLRRSIRKRQSSTKYTSHEYVTMTNGEKPECYQEAIESKERQKSVSTPLATHFILSSRRIPLNKAEKINMSKSAIHLGKNSTFHSRSKHIDVRYYWICDALNVKLLDLTKVHIDDNGAYMMTKAVLRGKFEVCCEIVRLEITST